MPTQLAETYAEAKQAIAGITVVASAQAALWTFPQKDNKRSQQK